MPYKKTALSPSEVQNVLNAMSPTGDTRSATKRLIEYLASCPGRITVDVSRTCSIGNISHYATAYINPKIKSLGFQIGCEMPPFPILNKFGECSKQHLWSFYRLEEAANDDIIEQGFREEIQEAAR